MATLASVVVKLGANTSGFITDMTRAAKVSETTTDKMARGFKVAATAIGSAVAGVAVATGKMVSDTAAQADKFQKLTDRIGGSVEAFSELEFVAERSGVKFETLTMGLQRMTRRIGEVANTGKGEAAPALEQLGLSAEKLANLPLDKQFEAIAEELSKVENTSIRTSLAMKVFDSDAVSLVQTMGEGAAGIQALRERARELGVSLSSETAAAAVEFRDRLTDVNARMDGMKLTIGSALLPEILRLSESFMNVGNGANYAAEAAEFLKNTLKVLASAALIVKNLFEALANVVVGFAVAAIEAFKGIWNAFQAFNKPMSLALDRLAKRDFKGARDAISQFGDGAVQAFKDAGEAAEFALRDQMGEAANNLGDIMEGLDVIWDDHVDLIERDAVPAYEETAKAAREAAEGVEGLTEAVESAERPVLELVEVTGQMRAGFDAVHPSMLMAADAAEESAQRMTSAMAGNTGVAAVIENTFKRLDDTLQGVWRDLIDGTSSATDAIKNLFKDMMAQLLHAAFTQPIVLSIGAAFTGATGAGMPGMSGGVPGLGSIFGGGSGGGGFLSGIGSLFTGNQIGMGLQNLPTWLGGTSTGLSNSAGFSLFGNASQYANWQYGLTGLLGGFLGDRIFGGMGGLGGGLGSTVGLAAGGSLFPMLGAFGGPLGAILGGLLGGALGGLFGDRPFEGGLGGENRIAARGMHPDGIIETVFGRVGGFGGQGGFGHNNDPNSWYGQFVGVMQEFDARLAGYLTADQFAMAQEALANWEVFVRDQNTAAQDILGTRFDTVLGVMPAMIRDFVDSFDGLEDRVNAFEQVVVAFNTMSAAVSAFINSDPAAEVERLINGTQEDSTTTLRNIGSALSDAIANFDGTPDQMMQIAALMEQRYMAEMEYLQAIQALVQTITQNIQSQRDQIEAELRGPDTREFSEFVSAIAQNIASLSGAASPEEIARLVQETQGLIGSAFNIANGLGENAFTDTGLGRGSALEQLLGFLNLLESESIGRLGQLGEEAAAGGDALRAEASLFADAFSIPLQDTTQAVNDATSAVNAQTEQLVQEHREEQRLLNRLADAMDDMAGEIAALREGNGRIGFIGG